ncbi:MAG: B12-binding domain-containing radical SAM protein [Candidatus Rokubacteria bacterium]|nr:B12-binding domain-containing radical SAM protein [Candidatus Rokubacteria bacterium]
MKREIRKIVFVEPKSTHLHVYSRVCIPRLGSVLLGTIMRNKGYDVRVSIEDIAPIDMNEVMSADFVAVSTLTSTAPQSYRLADKVRAAGIPVAIGGTHVSFLPNEGLQHADFVVRGEGELALQELVDAVQAGEGFEKIQNLSYLQDGQAVHNPERPKIPNLDINPIADYPLIHGWKPGGVVSVATSRGCPFSCTFCSVPGMYGHAFRTHSVDRVLEELKVHADSRHVFFADDIFTANKKRVKELLSRMIKAGITPEWGAQVRTETVDDPELLQLMRDSGCFNVYVGFESINPRTLKLFNKKQDLDKVNRAIDRFHAHNIRIHGMFVVGSDEDDVETIYATADFAKKRQIDSVQFMILTPIPGSPDWDTLYEKGQKYVFNMDWEVYDGHHVVHHPRRISPYELQVAAIDAMAKFYSWPQIIRSAFGKDKKDKYYAVIRYWGKRMIKDWWKQNGEYVERLKRDLYSEAQRLGPTGWRRVGVPEAFMKDKLGVLLKTFLAELGVEVVPVPEDAPAGSWRQSFDAVVMPHFSGLSQRVAKGREELAQRLQAFQAEIQAQLDKLPQVPFPLGDEAGPLFEPFAKIGLLFTSNLERVRLAYRKAGALEGFWEPVEA